MYIQAYEDYLENPEQLTSADAYLITSIIYQDLLFVANNFYQANNYRSPDRNVYTYVLDIYPKVDLLLQKQARYPGLGHAGEVSKEYNVFVSEALITFILQLILIPCDTS